MPLNEGTNNSEDTPKEHLSYGGKLAGVTFNPSQDANVARIKATYADIIDLLNNERMNTEDGEKKRHLSIAITEAQTAQMWAVKAVTWGL